MNVFVMPQIAAKHVIPSRSESSFMSKFKKNVDKITTNSLSLVSHNDKLFMPHTNKKQERTAWNIIIGEKIVNKNHLLMNNEFLLRTSFGNNTDHFYWEIRGWAQQYRTVFKSCKSLLIMHEEFFSCKTRWFICNFRTSRIGERFRSLFNSSFDSHEMEEHLVATPSTTTTGGESSNPDRQQGSGYTELIGGSVPCPSCSGSGFIPKELESTLVALIPLNDERLKPKRTWVFLKEVLCWNGYFC